MSDWPGEIRSPVHRTRGVYRSPNGTIRRTHCGPRTLDTTSIAAASSRAESNEREGSLIEKPEREGFLRRSLFHRNFAMATKGSRLDQRGLVASELPARYESPK